MSTEKIAQELEIDYNTAIVWRVYPSFKWQVEDIEYDPLKPLYVWIDNSHWWSDPHAIIIAQTDPRTHFIDIIDSIEINCSIPDIANFLAWAPKMKLNDNEAQFLERYKGYNWKRATFVSDPYDTTTTIKNIHNTQWIVIKEEYKKVGINLNTPKRIAVKTRIMNTKAQIYRLRVHIRNEWFISSIQNARYPEVGETSNRTTAADMPVHDWTSHNRTSLEYWVAWLLENIVWEKKRVATDTRPTRNKLTGELIYNSNNN